MEENVEDVLDQWKETPEKQWYEHWTLVYLPVIFIIIGVLFNIQHWPFASGIMAIGLFLAMLKSFIYFFVKKRPPHEWVYFLARITLFVVLLINFGFIQLSSSTFMVILSIYAVGVVVHLIKSKPKRREEENPEDDY